MKHTEGPWFASSLGIDGTPSNFHRNVHVFGPHFKPGEIGEAVDDMRLIAAAPEMFEALQSCQRLIDKALPKFDWGRSALDANAIRLLNEVPGMVKRAIAKAEGGKP